MTLILIAIILGSVCLDQLTKWLAVIYLQGEPSFRLWPDVLHLTFVKNEGAAFGILSGHRWVFMLISTLAIVGLAVYLFRFCRLGNWVKVSLAMIIGGGIGNMIDRVMLGYVIDFIDFTLINFAVFNVADSFVTVGAGILIVYLIVGEVREVRAARRSRQTGAAPAEDSHAGDAPSTEPPPSAAPEVGHAGDAPCTEPPPSAAPPASPEAGQAAEAPGEAAPADGGRRPASPPPGQLGETPTAPGPEAADGQDEHVPH